MTVQRRNILGPPADLGAKANQVDGQSPLHPRSGVINGDTRAVTDQGGVGTAAARAVAQEAFRAAQAAAGLVSGAGAAGTVVAPAGDVRTEGTVEPGGPGAVVAQAGDVVTRYEGGANLADSGPGQAVG
jgi:hypothetical protein